MPRGSIPARDLPSALGPRGSMRGPVPSPMKRGSVRRLGVGHVAAPQVLADRHVADDLDVVGRPGDAVAAALDVGDDGTRELPRRRMRHDQLVPLRDRDRGGVPGAVVDEMPVDAARRCRGRHRGRRRRIARQLGVEADVGARERLVDLDRQDVSPLTSSDGVDYGRRSLRRSGSRRGCSPARGSVVDGARRHVAAGTPRCRSGRRPRRRRVTGAASVAKSGSRPRP